MTQRKFDPRDRVIRRFLAWSTPKSDVHVPGWGLFVVQILLVIVILTGVGLFLAR